MRILQISSAKNFGGGERHFVDLCRGLHERGHDVFVLLRPTNEWRDRLDFLPKENFAYISIRNSFGVFSAPKIANFIRKKDIEIVHAHMGRDYFPASLACRIAKTAKFILTRHVLFPMRPFHRFALNNLSKAIAVSHAVAKNLRTLFPKEKVEIVSNGLETKSLAPEIRQNLRESFRNENNIPLSAKFIGTVGELKQLKGQEDFILAAQIISQKFPDSYFAVIGKDNSYDKAFRRKLKRLVKVFEVEERFLWLDWVEDTTSLYSALDVFVSASHSESFGLVILEALSNSTPVVATETEGAKELLHGENVGKLVPIGDPTKLANAIEELLNSEELLKLFAINGQNLVKENFSLKKMVDETERVYTQII